MTDFIFMCEAKIKLLHGFFLIPPLSITVALAVVGWHTMPHLTVVNLLLSSVPLLCYIVFCLPFFTIPVYLLYYILLNLLEKISKKNRIYVILSAIVGGGLSGLSVLAVPGLWRDYYAAEVFTLTCLIALILYPIACSRKMKPLFSLNKLKSACVAQAILVVLILFLSLNGCQIKHSDDEVQLYTPFIFQNGPGYKNIRFTLLPTGKNIRMKYPQDKQYDGAVFCSVTGIKQEDIVSLNRYGYYNTGVCIIAELVPDRMDAYMQLIPSEKMQDIKVGTCFKVDNEEWYSPRDVRGKIVKLTNNRLFGEQRLMVFNKEKEEVLLFIFGTW